MEPIGDGAAVMRIESGGAAKGLRTVLAHPGIALPGFHALALAFPSWFYKLAGPVGQKRLGTFLE